MDKPVIMRLGEWLELRAPNYFRLQEVWTPQPGTTTTTVTLQKNSLYTIEKHEFVRMFKDYDKYVDDNFNV